VGQEINGKLVEGSFEAHQVPLPKAKTDETELQALRQWLESYQPADIFTEAGDVVDVIQWLAPPDKALGQRVEAHPGYQPLSQVDWKQFAAQKGSHASSMQVTGKLLDKIYLAQNPTTLRIVSTDELVSNKLDAVFEHTSRNFQWDQHFRACDGRVIETLSEHQCQGFLQGCTLTGRSGVFPSYESFLGIIHTIMVQFSKFNKMECPWRGSLSSLN